MHRLIFMGSDPIALPALEAIAAGRCGAVDLGSVYTRPDKPSGRGQKVSPNEIKSWALARGLPVHQPERMGKEARLEIAEQRPDAILVMAFGHLLSQALIDVPRFGIWNLHTSLLPRYRGASPIQAAVASGDAETGVSLMRIVREMDAGPVLDVERARIGELDTSADVEARLAIACAPLVERALPRILAGDARPQEQDHAAATYVRKLGKEDGELDFRVSAAELARRINGLFPWPGARLWHGATPIKLGLAAADRAPTDAAPGEVLGFEADGLRVACGDGSVLLKRLQRPGGRLLDSAEFARGYALPRGTMLPCRAMAELVSPSPLRA